MIDLKKTEQELTNDILGKVSLSKDKERLESHIVNLSKCVVNLSKSKGVDLEDAKAQVVIVLDRSYSMEREYSNGTVQRVLDKLLPLGLTFDDDGEVNVFSFSSSGTGAGSASCMQLENMNIENYSDYATKEATKQRMAGTEYAGVLREIKEVFVTRKSAGKKGLLGFLKKSSGVTDSKSKISGTSAEECPVFVIFITDGDNDDTVETDDIIRELSKYNVFVQFIGIGNTHFKYLEKLDDLSGRECDNTGFTKFANIENVPSDELYNTVLDQFADWLKDRMG